MRIKKADRGAVAIVLSVAYYILMCSWPIAIAKLLLPQELEWIMLPVFTVCIIYGLAGAGVAMAWVEEKP